MDISMDISINLSMDIHIHGKPVKRGENEMKGKERYTKSQNRYVSRIRT